MTPAQQSALAGLVGRPLTVGEVSAIDPHLETRNDVAIAAILSKGRIKHGPTRIGSGTVVAVMNGRGGDFLDAVEELGKTNRDIYWGMDPVRRGEFDNSVPQARAWLETLKGLIPGFDTELSMLSMVGAIADPIPFERVSAKLNEVQP